MYWQGTYHDMHTPEFLTNYVHEDMRKKYEKSGFDKSLEEKAKILQEFFQTIKNYSHGITNSSNMFDDAIIEIILNNMYEKGTFFAKNAEASKTFFRQETKQDSLYLERELASIIEAIYREVATEDTGFNKKEVWVGSKKGTVFNIGNTVYDKTGLVAIGTEIMEEVAKELGVKTYKVIKNKADGSKLKQYYIPYVDGKVDVKGYEIDIKADANEKMREIYELLKNCAFSAKNYSSMSWDKELQQKVFNTKTKHIEFGDSSFYRAIYGSLTSLGYDNKTAISAVFAGNNRLKNKNGDSNVEEHFYHLRYLYELTGSGIRKSENLELFEPGVNFIVFNDPTGSNIYVKTTQSLIRDMLTAKSTFKKWDSRIQISKSKFY